MVQYPVSHSAQPSNGDPLLRREVMLHHCPKANLIDADNINNLLLNSILVVNLMGED